MASRHRLLIVIIGLATAMPWVLAGCATTSAPAQDVSWLVGRWQGEFTARGTLARVGATSGPVTMELRDEGGGFVSGEITGMATPCTLRGRGTDTGYAGSASIVSSVAGNFEMPFEFTGSRLSRVVVGTDAVRRGAWRVAPGCRAFGVAP